MPTNRTTSIRKMTITAILAAMSAVLMFFSINVPLMPSFIKLDFSDIPAVIAGFMIGPISGVVVSFVKNLLNLLTSSTGGVGELSNFLLSATFVLTSGLIFKKWKTIKGAVIGTALAAITMGLASVAFNFFLVYPIYFNFMPIESILGLYNVINPYVGTEPTDENLLKALIMFNMPFTMIKGLLGAFVVALIYKPMLPIINGTRV